MSKKQDKVVPLCAYDSDAALERLNRLTGLRFARWPESLLAQAHTDAESAQAVTVGPAPVVAESISA